MANASIMHKNDNDMLECYIYPKICYTLREREITDTMLNEEIVQINEKLSLFINEYMWHREPLIFHSKTKQMLLLDQIIESSTLLTEFQTLPHIYASLRFDEDIGDEWFVTFLMFELTKMIDGLIVRLVDSDGEFLLIEAANVLPVWATPEKCQDNVFIHNGVIHAVQDRGNSFSTILNNINESPFITKLSEQVQLVLQKRIGVYPEEMKKRWHKARAFLPEKAALILHQEPSLVASAIRTICHSDPLERKVCRAMRYFPPEQRVMVNVQTTRCLYAMVTHCRYTGDPRTGWNLPPSNSSKYNAHVLGVKMACGLEMLVARAHEDRRRKMKNKSREKDKEKSKPFEKALDLFLTRLEANGYFRNLLEGSQEHEQRFSSAKNYFLANSNKSDFEEILIESEAERVLEAWQNAQTNDFEMHAQDESTLSPVHSDSWLNVDPLQLEQLLNQRLGDVKDKKKYDREPLGLKEKVQAFLNQTSDIDGVQFLQEHLGDDEIRHDPEDGGKIDFDTDVFDSTLRDILDLIVPGGEGEFEGSSEGSLGGDDEDEGGEMDKYMKLLDSQLKVEMVKEEGCVSTQSECSDTIEANLVESLESEAGGSGPTGNIIGGPIRRLMHLQLQSNPIVPPDLQS